MSDHFKNVVGGKLKLKTPVRKATQEKEEEPKGVLIDDLQGWGGGASRESKYYPSSSATPHIHVHARTMYTRGDRVWVSMVAVKLPGDRHINLQFSRHSNKFLCPSGAGVPQNLKAELMRKGICGIN